MKSMSKCGFKRVHNYRTLKSYEQADQPKEISVPTLFTCGRYDEATPSASAYHHSMLPGSEIAIFEDASHRPFKKKVGILRL
jgi:pimeloyl-ACP methyl ester carboxylesterase